MEKLYSIVWTGTLVVVGGIIIASRCYPDGSIDPDLMNIWLIWTVTLASLNFLSCDLRFIVGIQTLLLAWLAVRIHFKSIYFPRFLLVLCGILLLIAGTTPFRLLIFILLSYYLFYKDFEIELSPSAKEF
jgi:hypothetical protein